MIVRRRVTMFPEALLLVSVLCWALPHADSDSPGPSCFLEKRACCREDDPWYRNDRVDPKACYQSQEKRRGGERKSQQRKSLSAATVHDSGLLPVSGSLHIANSSTRSDSAPSDES